MSAGRVSLCRVATGAVRAKRGLGRKVKAWTYIGKKPFGRREKMKQAAEPTGNLDKYLNKHIHK